MVRRFRVPPLPSLVVWLMVLVVSAPRLAASGDFGVVTAPPAAPAMRSESLAGELLVAAPGMTDPRFAHTVIYLVHHDTRGALGLIVNRVLGSGPLHKLLEGFGVKSEGSDKTIQLYYGGPVEMEQGFVLHTDDYRSPGTRVLGNGLALTSEVGVLQAIAQGVGPRHSLFALGYAGWGPGQLEQEIGHEDWLGLSAREDLIFGEIDSETTWKQAIAEAGVEL